MDSISGPVRNTESNSMNLLNESETSKVETTAEEIKEYVKQFKVEVEGKFQMSKANKKFKFPKNKETEEV